MTAIHRCGRRRHSSGPRRHRTIPRRTPGLQHLDCGNLLPDVRRTVQQTPRPSIGRNRQTRLGTALYAWVIRPGKFTYATTTIPLRTAATGGRPQHHNFHINALAGKVARMATKRSASVFGGIVVVDFQGDADFFYFRFRPLHRLPPKPQFVLMTRAQCKTLYDRGSSRSSSSLAFSHGSMPP